MFLSLVYYLLKHHQHYDTLKLKWEKKRAKIFKPDLSYIWSVYEDQLRYPIHLLSRQLTHLPAVDKAAGKDPDR